MTPRIRRWAAAVVSAALVWTAPGPHAHQAFAGEFGRSSGAPLKGAPQVPSAGAAVIPGLPSVAVPSLGLAPVEIVLPAEAAVLRDAPAALAAPQAKAQAQAQAASELSQRVEAVRQTLAQPGASGEQAAAAAQEVLEPGRPVKGRAEVVSVTTAPAPRLSGLSRFAKRVRRAAAVVVLGLALAVPSYTQAQSAPPKDVQELQTLQSKIKGGGKVSPGDLKKLKELQQKIAQAQNPAPQTGASPSQAPSTLQSGTGGSAQVQVPAPQPAPEVVVLSQDAAVAVTYDFRGAPGVTVGDRFDVVVTVENKTGQPMVLSGLRGSIEDILPIDVELGDSQVPDTVTVQPGQTAQIKVEVIAFNSGELKFEGPMFLNTGSGRSVEIAVAVPELKIPVTTVLTPDWKEKGLRDIKAVERQKTGRWYWFIAAPLLLLILWGIERGLAHYRRRTFRPVDREPLLKTTRERLAALEAGSEKLSEAAFYEDLYSVLDRFLVDYHGLPLKARQAARLKRDLKASGKYGAGQIAVAAELAERAEAARFGRRVHGPEGRKSDLASLRQLVDHVSGETKDSDAKAPGAGLSFSDPLALLLLLPLGAYLLWGLRHRKALAARQAVRVSSVPGKRARSLRERLTWLPRALRVMALTALIIGAAGPRYGVTRSENFTPSTDTVMELDISGSMDEPMATGYGGSIKKLDGAKLAIKGYVDEQRRGTSNRVGLGTFGDETYQDVRLTTDYDALLSKLKELESKGGTAVGKAVLAGIGHFAEINILELEDQGDPQIIEVQKLLRSQGLPAALAYAKDKPDLMNRIIRPDRPKILVLFTDGQSNEGIPPLEAAQIAKGLGVKVYTVGVGNANGGFDAATMQGIAEMTGGQFYHAADAGRMREVLLEISRLEKAPSKIIASVSVNEYSRHFILLALLAFLLELGLANTRLRVLHALLILGLPFAGMDLPQGVPVQRQQTEQSASVAYRSGVSAVGLTTAQAAQDPLPLTGVPEELKKANELYLQGRYDDALKKYAEALERFPEMSELYYNMGNTYVRLGQPDRAIESYQKFLQLSQDPVRRSNAFFNMGNAAVLKRDGEAALDFYKQALRAHAGNMDAKWNLEVLKKAQQEQQQKDGKQGGKQKKNRRGQQGQQGQQGQPGDQQGQPGDQQGQPGNQQGNQQGSPGDKDKSPADRLGDELGKEQGAQDQKQRQGITRRGNKVWGGALLGLLGGGSTALTFSSPWIAAAALILIPLGALLICYGIYKKLQAAKAYAPQTAPDRFSSWWGRKRFIRKSGAILLALGLLTLAASGPKSGYRDDRVNFGGKDILVTVDGSHSMIYAEDGRLDKTKAELIDFIKHMQGTDRIGLVVFSGHARTASPLSIDYSNFEYKIGRLEHEARGLQEGSDLAAAIRFTAKSFENSKKVGERQRVMIVVSDGDVFDQEVEEAIRAAREHDVVVYTIGVGNPGGTRMKIPTADGKGTEYLVDSQSGQPALTRLNETQLRRIADGTGGAYFRAGPQASMSKIVERIAELQKGSKGDTIRSPRDVSGWFAWPALALLIFELLTPMPSLLRRPKKDEPKPKKKTGAAGLGLFGLGALPLSAWPVILPFSIVLFGGALFFALDALYDGALVRAVSWRWQRMRGVVAKGADAEPASLFEMREADAARFNEFAKAWAAAAKPEARAELIEQAEADEQLWREKLVWAFTRGSDAATQVQLARALERASKARLEVPAAQVRRLILLGDGLPWLMHVDPRTRLAQLASRWLDPAADDNVVALQRLASFPDDGVRVRAERALGERALARPPTLLQSARKSFRSKLVLGATALALMASLTLVGFSGYKTAEFRAERAKASETATRIFFGEDLYIFTDRYADDRIPKEVLPALRRWHAARGTLPAEELGRAIQILRESPDPKADNVLEVFLKHADVLPLSGEAETLLLTTLIERDSDRIWKFLGEHLVASADNPRMVRIMARMAAIAASSPNETIFLKSYFFLLSPNEELRAFAAQLIYENLEKKPDQFFQRLTAAQAAVGRMPLINLFIERFALIRLSTSKITGADAAAARVLLESVVVRSAAVDAVRVQALIALEQQAAAKAQGRQTGPDIEVPEPYLVAVLDMMKEALAEAGRAPGGAPAALTDQLKAVANSTTTRLIKEAEALYPDLHERLVKEGVLPPDETSTHYGYGEHGPWGGRFGGGGYSSTTKKYRDIYKLEHLRKLRAVLAELSQGAAAETGETGAKKKELAERADQALERLLDIGQASGMLEGTAAGEKAAEPVNAALKSLSGEFVSTHFLIMLRDAGLAPLNGVSSGDAMFAETYSKESLVKLEAVLRALASGGKGWTYGGDPRDMTFSERRALVQAIDAVAAARLLHFPEAGSSAPAKDEAAFWSRFEDPAEAPLALARLTLEQDARADDLEFQRRALERLAKPLPAGADSAQLGEVFSRAAAAFEKAGRGADALDALRAVVEASGPAGPAAEAARAFVQSRTTALLGSSSGLLSDEELVDAGVKVSGSGHRKQYKVFHIERLVALAESELAREKAPTGSQKEAAAKIALEGPRLAALARAAGVPEGGAIAERRADAVNGVLMRGYQIMPGTTFYDSIKKLGQTAATGSPTEESGYKTAYTDADLRELRQFLNTTAGMGSWPDAQGAYAALTLEQKAFFVAAVDLLDALLRDPNALSAVALSVERSWALIEDPSQRALAPVRLRRLLDAQKADKAFLLDAARRFPALVGRGPAFGAEQTKELLLAIVEASEDDVDLRKAQLEAVSAGLSASSSPELKAAVAALVESQAALLIAGATTEFSSEKDKEAFAKSGLLIDDEIRERRFKQSHLKALLRETEAAARRAGKDFDQDQRRARAVVRSLAPALVKLGEQAGLPTGAGVDDHGVDEINVLNEEGYDVFDGSAYRDALIAHGLAPKTDSTEAEDRYYDSYPQDRLQALRDFVAGRLASGQGWDGEYGKDRPLDEEERAFLERKLKRLDQLLAERKSPAKLHGFSLGALGTASLASMNFVLTDLWPLVFVGALIGLGYWFVRRYAPAVLGDDAPGEPEGFSEAQAARAKRLDFAATGFAKSVVPGEFQSRFIGARGSERAGTRAYQPGDDVRRIDWRATARLEKTVTKRYMMDKELPLYIVFDASGSGTAGVGATTKRQAAEDAAGLLILAAAKHNIAVGAVIVTDRVESFIPARGGLQHAHELVRRLQSAKTESRLTDLNPGLQAVVKRVPTRAMVAVVSDLIAPDFKSGLAAVAGRHDLRVFRVVDDSERDAAPEVGLVAVQDSETGEVVQYDTSSSAARAEQTQSVLERERRIAEALSGAGAAPVILDAGSDYLQAVQDAFNPKAKKQQKRK